MSAAPRFRVVLLAAALLVGLLSACTGATPSARPPSPSAPVPTSSTAPPTSAAPTTPPQATPARTTPARTTAPPTSASRAPAVATPAGGPLPLPFATGSASQVITVVAPGTASTTATLQAWARTGAGWVRHGPAVAAHTGSQGLTTEPRETLSATPIGSFTLTRSFGSAADPGTGLPYFRTDESDWWVSDPTSRYYNTHYRCAQDCPFDTADGENLYRAGYVYTYAVVIDANTSPVVAGHGSAFFLHVTNGEPTAGCVSIDEADLVSIMQWLTPAAHPRILIGTG